MPSVPFGEPTELIAGDSWRWDLQVSEYPPSAGWELVYAFGGRGKFPDLVATPSADGDWYSIRSTPTQTAELEGGPYDFAVFVRNGTDRFTIRQGTLQVVPNIDQRAQISSHTLRVLEVLDAAIEGRLTKDMESFAIGGRTVNRIPMQELVRLRGIYLAKLRRQMARDGGQLGRSVGVRFGRAS